MKATENMAETPDPPEKTLEPPSTDAAPAVAEATQASALPVLAEDGLEKAILGLALEINKLLAAPKNMMTFETVQQIAGVGHQVVLLRTLLRDVSVEDLADDALPEEIAGLFQNQDGNYGGGGIIGPYVGGNIGRGGLAGRVGARIQRARGRNQARRGGGAVAAGNPIVHNQRNQDAYHQPDGYGGPPIQPMGQGAPFNAPQADFEDGDENAYAAARELRGLIKDLKDERAALMRENGDDHPELPGLNARITKLKDRLDRLMGWLLDEPASDAVTTPAHPAQADPEPKPEQEPETQVDRAPLSCTNCDQVQNQFWRDGDGNPLPCDICGSPMRDDQAPPEPLEADGAVRQNDADPQPPREQTP